MNNQPSLRFLANWTKRAVDYWAKLVRREDGANLVIIASLMTAMIGFAGLAIDGSNIYYQNQRMQIAADAAALGGARQLALSADHDAVDAEIQHLGKANAADTVTWTYINNNRGVHVVAKRTFSAYFARMFGYDSFTARGESEAQYEPVTGVDDLFPLTMDCDCVDEEYVIPGGGDGGHGGGGGGGGNNTKVPGGTTNPDDDLTSPTEGTISLSDSSVYSIMFVGRTDNTWTYQVDKVSGRDLNHWLLGIDSCLDSVVTYGPSAELGMDGSTGVTGIKWNVGSGFSSGQFSFTLNENVPAGTVDALVQAGNEFKATSIRGPICNGTNRKPGAGSGMANICLPTIDFETDAAGAALATGQIIDTEWAAWGMRVTSNNPSKNPPMIFNTASPTGGDTDLGSPNEDFGGPGEGKGGRSGQPGQNSTPQGKVLIIAERNNSAEPDDNAGGGSLIFNFDYPVRIDEVRVLDLDDIEAAGTVKAYSDSGGSSLIATGKMLGLGENSLQTVAVNAVNVRRLEVVFPESGSLATLVSCRNQAVSTYSAGNLIWSDLNSNGLQDTGEPGIPGVLVNLYLAGHKSVIAQAMTNAGGTYKFENLPPGDYEVKIVDDNFDSGQPLTGAVYSPANAGGDDALDSDFNSSTNRAAVTIVDADVETLDAGFVTPTESDGKAGPEFSEIVLEEKNKTTRYEISLVSQVGPTWTYNVREVEGRNLDHWDLGIEDCLDNIVSYNPTTDFASGQDGSTGFVGIQWGVAPSFSEGTFSFTLDKDYPAGTVRALATSGSMSKQVAIIGPNCSGRDPNSGLGGYSIDGTVPDDAGIAFFPDPSGNASEFGPANGSDTKVGVIHSALPPMLDFKNPDNQTDFRGVWMDATTDSNGDVWLYAAWERDSNHGSGFISFEFQQGGLSGACDYSASEQTLVATCNPWANRQPGDFLVLWDVQGNSTEIGLRTFGYSDTNPANGEWDGQAAEPLTLSPITMLNTAVSRAAFSSDNYRGELAINLSATVLPSSPDECLSIENVIPGSVTGNSDMADYKDVVFGNIGRSLGISSCDEPDEDEACSFGWLDWNGGATGYLELAGNMNNTGNSGVWRLGEVIAAGPDVAPSSPVDAALDARLGTKIKIPLTQYNGHGYAICGFAQVELVDYNLEEDNNWLSLQFLKTLLHGVETDPTSVDFGVRDVRFVR